MSKQKRPDTYDTEISETPKHLRKRKKKPKKKRTAPKEFTCPFCEHTFKLRSYWVHYFRSREHPSSFKCKNCGAGPWGYMREEEVLLPKWLYGRRAWAKQGDTQKVWTPEYCTFCNVGANFINSKEHYFMLWSSPKDDVYCDQCGFRGKIGGKRK